VTTFYCLRFETPPARRARSLYLYPPGTGRLGYIPRNWVRFRRLLRLAGLRWKYSNPPPRGRLFVNALLSLESVSESYVTTDGQSASLSWNKVPIWGLRSDFYYCQTVAGLLIWTAFSNERTGLSFTTAAGSRQHSHSRVRVPWDS
jgi:hypothetical protein